jgi:hypothetical protein
MSNGLIGDNPGATTLLHLLLYLFMDDSVKDCVMTPQRATLGYTPQKLNIIQFVSIHQNTICVQTCKSLSLLEVS